LTCTLPPLVGFGNWMLLTTLVTQLVTVGSKPLPFELMTPPVGEIMNCTVTVPSMLGRATSSCS
jgi:hypothetical protein